MRRREPSLFYRIFPESTDRPGRAEYFALGFGRSLLPWLIIGLAMAALL